MTSTAFLTIIKTHRLVCRAALGTMAKRWKRPKCPSAGGWINRMGHKHTTEVRPAMKKEGRRGPRDSVEGPQKHYSKYK